MEKLNCRRVCAAFLLCAATAIALPAQTVTTLVNFNGTDGLNAYAPLIQGTNGNFYGTTGNGGLSPSLGTLFEVNSSGTVDTLYTFQGTAGANPFSPLTQGTDGLFYGTALDYGQGGGGTIFKMTSVGTLTVLHNFSFGDGAYPYAGLVQGRDGRFYGTTQSGGTTSNGGTVFSVTSKGTFTTLYNFCSQAGCSDGQDPSGAVVQAIDGNFYGTTSAGGANGNYGTIFKITSTGTLTTLYSFCSQSGCADGFAPAAGLVQATDGNFYGTTFYGGVSGYGTVFRITPAGTLTTLYSFCPQSLCADGAGPSADLIQATDGNLYGTTYEGGAIGSGTIFKITLGGTFTTLYSFAGYPNDGGNPGSALLQVTNGTFYGTTIQGGASNVGVVFTMSAGLGPFVKTQPTSGKVGVGVKILGNNLTGATSVKFNGTPAAFKVASSSLITATVPVGATSGKVQVVTPSGTLSSNVPFRVLP